MSTTIEYTAAERKSINLAWTYVIAAAERTRWDMRARLKLAFSFERKASGSQAEARAGLLEVFVDAFNGIAYQRAADLDIRIGCMIAAVFGVTAAKSKEASEYLSTGGRWGALMAGVAAHRAAITRYTQG